jgi:hypothetical protein
MPIGCPKPGASLLLALALLTTPTLVLAQTTVRFDATEDTYVSSSATGANYGSATVLNTDTVPMQVAYLKFDVSLPTHATITGAKLHLNTTTPQSQSGVFVYAVTPSSWSESSLTYSNQPTVGAQVGSTGAWTTAGWKVATLPATAVSSGTQSFAVLANNDYVKVFGSSESANPPALEVTYTTTSTSDPAPNCIGEPADHPVVNYPEPRVFIESQGWWAERLNGTVKKYGDSEHLHIGACFPLQKTVAGSVRMDFRVVAHNIPAGSTLRNTRFHDGNGGVTLADIAWNRTIAAGEHDVVLWRTVQVDTSKGQDGLRETRPLTVVVRPDGAEIHTSGGWCWDVENGKTDSNHGLCTSNTTEGRGWYDCFEYKSAMTAGWVYPYAGVPAGQSYTLNIHGVDGAEGTTVIDRHYATLDPNFHAGNNGTFLIDALGANRNAPLTLPGSLLTPGVHYIFIMSEEDGRCTTLSPGTVFPNQIVPQDGEVSGGLRIPIKVNP